MCETCSVRENQMNKFLVLCFVTRRQTLHFTYTRAYGVHVHRSVYVVCHATGWHGQEKWEERQSEKKADTIVLCLFILTFCQKTCQSNRTIGCLVHIIAHRLNCWTNFKWVTITVIPLNALKPAWCEHKHTHQDNHHSMSVHHLNRSRAEHINRYTEWISISLNFFLLSTACAHF